MAANDRQIGGSHYKTDGLEHWDMVVHFKLDYFQGQITKYVMRWRDKGGIADLEKAQHFLEKYKEVETLKKLDQALGGTGEVSVVQVSRAVGKGKRVSRRKVPSARKR
jgi:hypothetical protein